jgi:hypothetical protein
MIQIGDKFQKPISKGKMGECKVVDIVNRISTASGECIGVEYWAQFTDTKYHDLLFEVAKSTIEMGK